MTGKCPECGEIKEITLQGAKVGMCDDCYTKKYTCAECGEKITDAWGFRYAEGKGNVHNTCLKPDIEATEQPSEAAAEKGN